MKPGRDAAQRRPRRDPGRGGRRRRPRGAAGSPAPRSTCSTRSRPTGSPLLDAPNTLLTPHLGRLHGRGPGRRGRGGRRADPRGPRRPPGPVRGQRAAAHARDGPGDRALPAAGGDARPVRRPVRAVRAADAHARDRRRARGATTPRRWWRPSCAACSRRRRRSASTWSTRRPSPRRAGSRSSERKTPDAGTFSSLLTLTAEVEGRTVTVAGHRRQRRAADRRGSTSTRWTSPRRTRC